MLCKTHKVKEGNKSSVSCKRTKPKETKVKKLQLIQTESVSCPVGPLRLSIKSDINKNVYIWSNVMCTGLVCYRARLCNKVPLEFTLELHWNYFSYMKLKLKILLHNKLQHLLTHYWNQKLYLLLLPNGFS